MLRSKPLSYNIYVNRKSFDSYIRYLSEQEYRLVKKRIVEVLKPSLKSNASLLDIGCWDGEVTNYYSDKLGVKDIYGVDIFPEIAEKAKNNNVKVGICNFENERLPFDDQQFDIVIANQVFEHLKNIYHLMDEINRVLKTGGILLFSVPNLASLHCRLQVLFGIQPSIIKLFEAHVRVFTPSALKKFLTFGNQFKIKKFTGSGYYPFPPCVSEILSKALPSSSLFMVYVLQKNNTVGVSWKKEIECRGLQSVF